MKTKKTNMGTKVVVDPETITYGNETKIAYKCADPNCNEVIQVSNFSEDAYVTFQGHILDSDQSEIIDGSHTLLYCNLDCLAHHISSLDPANI